MTDDKVRENRLRRMADRQGLILRRSRRRDRRATDYGAYWLDDAKTGKPMTSAEGIDLDAIEDFLAS